MIFDITSTDLISDSLLQVFDLTSAMSAGGHGFEHHVFGTESFNGA